jgi:hypothetical protein
MSSRSASTVVDIRGAQRPRLCHIPDYVGSAGDEAIALAELAGLYLDDWQQFVVRHAFGERADGKWAAPTVGLCVGRQNGKGAILEAIELAGLFLFDEALIIHTAHLQKTATAHFRRMVDLIRGVPEFDARVAATPRGKGSEAIELHGGQQVIFTTRAGGGGRGLSAARIVYDEAMFLGESDRSSISPTQAAQSMHGNTQTLYVGSAVDEEEPSHDGVPFAQVREAGLAGNARVAWFEWSAQGDDPSRVPDEIASDPEIWAQANPGLGIRISEEYVEHERTVELGRRGFAVERLGIGAWPDTTGDAERTVPREIWAACGEHDQSQRITGSQTFAIDVSPDQAWGAINVAGRRDDLRWQGATVEHKRGVDWIVPMCVALMERRCQLVVDARGPASMLIAELEAAGITETRGLIKASTDDYANACAGFVKTVATGMFRYPAPQPELDDALVAARPGTMGDRWKWKRRTADSGDITTLVAQTLALWGAQTQRPKPAPRVIDLSTIE